MKFFDTIKTPDGNYDPSKLHLSVLLINKLPENIKASAIYDWHFPNKARINESDIECLLS